MGKCAAAIRRWIANPPFVAGSAAPQRSVHPHMAHLYRGEREAIPLAEQTQGSLRLIDELLSRAQMDDSRRLPRV